MKSEKGNSQLPKPFGNRSAQQGQPKVLHHMFEAQVPNSPEAVAVVFENHHLTYAALDARANQLAGHLRSLGVRRGDLVGIFAERSLDLVIALFGTLKAGAAYVPIDPGYPADRVRFMLEDSQVPVLVTQTHLRQRVPAYGGRVLTLETDWVLIELYSPAILAGSEEPDDLAYMIYTSGSTGRPKGAMNTHRGICNRLLWMQAAYKLEPDDHVLQKTPFSFDVSVWEFFWPLLTGARLILATPNGHRDSTYLRNLIQQEGITTLHFVPSMLRNFLQEPAVEACGKVLRRVISSGEALSGDLQAQFFSRLPTVDLHNLYGPTEAAVDVTAWHCHPDTARAMVPIGRPIANIQIHLLDASGQLVPSRLSGELHISGVGIGRGYHRRPDLTAATFIPDSVSGGHGNRLYKTGDLARYRQDGTLDYLGRIDHQVKIRGFRIECGEIESALTTHPSIREAVVVAREDESHLLRLVAYLISRDNTTPTTSELYTHLKRFLPDYMLPARIITLAMFPLTPNGKIDRGALPPPDFQRPPLQNPFVSPTTSTEMNLAKIWSQVLEITPVGIHDSFFELGGDSIRAIQVVALAHQQGMPLTLAQLYTAQTIGNLAQQPDENELRVHRIDAASAPFSFLSSEDRRQLPDGLEDAYPLTSLQTGMFFHNKKNPASAIFHDIFSFRISCPFDRQIFQEVLDRFIERHASVRTSFDLGSFTKPLQLVHSSAWLPLAVENFQHLDETAQSEALKAWIEIEKTRPFDPARAPLLRMTVHRYRTDEFQLIISFHHAILDGWSLAVMLTEILQDYAALLRGMPSSISALATPYQRYVALEQEALDAPDSLKFWMKKLHNPDILLLPRRHSRVKPDRIDQIRGPEVPIPNEIFEGLKNLTLKAKTPLKSALLAAHFRVMNALHGRDDVISGIITHGRPEEVDGARMIGLFLNTLPLRLHLNGGTWRELVQQVFRAEREVIPHRRFPLAAIQQATGGETLFETAFDFVHFHVYRNLERSQGLGLQEGQYFEANNFTLFTTFFLDSTGAQLHMHIDYDPTQLEAQQIECINRYYLNTLISMALDPEARYERFSLLSAEERGQQLLGWNVTTQPYSGEKGLHKLFEKQVEYTPDTVAVFDGIHALSFASLNQQANQLAYRLATMGVGPDIPVAVCVTRSADMLVALLAILKAGGAYVPLDPTYPPSWLETVLQDTQASVLLTHRRWLSHLSVQNRQILLLDEINPCTSGKEYLQNPSSMIHAENLVYLLYTSGSTGHPKGVAITHRNALALMEWGQKQFLQEELEGVLASTSICFDLSVFEIFLPLSRGGTIILAENALALPTIPAASQVTLINSVPSVVQELLHIQRLPLSIRVVNLAGEPLRAALVQKLYEEPGVRKVYDLYGPSETTTYSSMALRRADGPETIGQPITNEQIYLVDHYQQLLPMGVAGQLLIGGAGISRGYYRRPDLTAEKFIPNGLSPHLGTRLYQTGDQGRYRPDGQIEYLGRFDHQVKLRGFRIELGQVEASLHSHPEIEQAVVLCRENRPGHKTLVAYVVPRNDSPIEAATMRSYLSAQLPAHMIPGVFVPMKTIPLTSNGKVDRKALPEPEPLQRADSASVPPRTPLEELLVEIWRNLLKVDRIGVYDHFFELGGHSLLATRLISRVQQQCHLDISLKDFFENPTVAGLGDKLNALQHESSRVPLPPLQPVIRTSPLPLSYSQQQLWLVEQLESGSTAYTLPYAWRVTGVLQVETLERSVNALIERHEALRMYVVEHEGEPRQAFRSQLVLTLPVVDLQMIPHAEQEQMCQAYIREAEAHPFDLQQGPLIRVALYRLAPEDHVLVLTLHHIVTDGWSMDILFSDLRHFYEAFQNGHPPTLAPLPIQYADYAVWQRACLHGDILQSRLTYWTTRLADVPDNFAIPTDHRRPVVQTFQGGNLTRQLAPEMVQSLKTFCQAEGVTMFMTLLAVLQTLLARHSGQDDIVVGTPVAHRNRVELERVVGLFLNTLVLRTDLSGAPTFRELVCRVREVCLEAYAHQELPFEKLVEVLHPVRDLSRTSLFQVFFNLVDVTDRRLTLPGVTLQPLRNHEEATAKFDLTLYVFLTEDRGWLTWNYNTDLFEHRTSAWLFDHYETLLEGLLGKPDAPVSTVSVFGEEGRPFLHAPLPVVVPTSPLLRPFQNLENTRALAGRFEQMVTRHPHQPAVHTSESTWTYAELNRRANRVAHTLLDVLPPSPTPLPVGLLCAPGGSMLAGLLGVLKAGHPYVPLEPTLPLDRLETIATDATLTTILCNLSTVEHLPALRQRGYQVILIDEEHLVPEDANPQISISSDTLAYVLYTSGTTGVPKGVLQTHRNVLHHIGAYTTNLQIGPHDRLTLLASFSFDAAVMDIFGALLNGATLYPLNLQETGPEEISSWLAQQAITIYHSTPTVYRYWLKHVSPGTTFPSLRLVVLGGEEATRADFDAYHQHFGRDCFFVNGLGPTESTVSLQFMASQTTCLTGQTVPVGFPVQDTEVHLLDDAGQSTDVYGEIVLGSPYVALGYWQKPELTQRAFSGASYPNGIRQYRTGDLGRYRPDGMLEFRGRKDNQVKLRGYRIELGEIEVALRNHPAVTESVVVCLEETSGEKQLVAYVVGQATMNELRSYLQSRLPGAMVPAAFVFLKQLPITPNGKVDKRALPAPVKADHIQGLTYVAPRTPLEQTIASIWQDLLKVPRIGVQDNFFELGGHSLLATQVISRLRTVTHSDLSVRTLFDCQTIAQLANNVEGLRSQKEGTQAPPLCPQNLDGPIPLSFAQQRLWFLEQWSPGNSTYLLSCTWRLQGPLDIGALEASLTALTTRHETLRTSCAIVEGQPVQVIHPVGPVSLPFQDLTTRSESKQEADLQRLIQQALHQPFDLTTGPLWRGQLLRLGPEEHVLLLLFHHIITDGWSMGIVFQELSVLYAAHTACRPPTLSPLPLQYADFALWQRLWLQGDVLDRQLTYWRSQLVGAPPSLTLPTDRPRPPQQTYRGNKISFTISSSLTHALKALCQQEGVTLFMTLLAVFQLLLARYSGQRDILVGTPIAGRTHRELEGLIGFFVNTLVLRMQVNDQLPFREILRQVRETCLEAYAHQDLPFEKLVEALHPVRDPSRHPLFQVMFQVFTTKTQGLSLAGVHTTQENIFLETAKFDLNCLLQEHDGSLRGTLEFNTDIFFPHTIQRLIRHYQQFLEELVTNPTQRVNTLPIVTEEERKQQVIDWNDTATNYPQEASLPRLFEGQVARTPDAVAVVFDGQHLTYAELDARANQLARHLHTLGVGRTTLVGIFAERSLELLIALYATLKAGAAYVPIDPAYPADRVLFMLQDSEVPVLLTQAHLRSRVPPYNGQIVTLETDWLGIEKHARTTLAAAEGPDDLAYMIYTSGSTGQPKGAMNTHRGICNRLLWMQSAYTLHANDRVLHKTPFSFDVSVWELFWPLLTGARLVLAIPDGHRDSQYLRDLILQEDITTLHFVPSMLQSFLRESGVKSCITTLRNVISSGEALSGDLQALCFERLPGVPLHNLYGPTEAAVDVTAWPCQPDAANTMVPIGRPIANIHIYLLDAHQQLVPSGLPGQLYIGGVGLARGYHRRPDLTASKFIPDPLSTTPGGRVYQTGDLARYRPDGTIEYLGRLDHQVKIRGFRIELGEIEATLTHHPAVREAIVLCLKDNAGDNKLVAYVVATSHSPFEPTTLRTYLSTQIPDYMVPSTFVCLDTLPLTPNGKVDHKALPAPGPTQRPKTIAYIPPRTHTEELITDIWRDLLKVDRISVQDNFFELGGHSLLATQVVSRVREQLGIEVTLASLFELPTVECFAEGVEGILWVRNGQSLEHNFRDGESEEGIV